MIGLASGPVPSSVVAVAVVVIALSAQYRAFRSILGQNLVQLLTRSLDDGDAAVDLRGLSGTCHLLGGAGQSSECFSERADFFVGLAGGPQRFFVLFRFGAAFVRQGVSPASIDVRRTHEPFVLEHLQVWVDRARARAPKSAAHLLEAPHDLVTVSWLLAQGEQDGCANGTSSHPPAATPTTSAATPAHAGATHGVGEEVVVLVLVVRSVVVVVVVVVGHVISPGRSGLGWSRYVTYDNDIS